MIKHPGIWRQLLIALTVIWSIVALMYGWLYLPRAAQIPHNPQFLSKLSNEAASILFRRDAEAEPARGALVWLQTTMMVRMSNGARLTFPATTTDERAAFVAGEYRQLLDSEAGRKRVPYLLKLLAVWLAPMLLLAAGLTASRSSR